MGAKILFKEESYKIMGACFDVYKEMGNGFLEAVYQECLEYAFGDLSIPFLPQPEVPLEFRKHVLRTKYKPDFLCYGSIVVELKAVSSLIDEHRAQVLNYLNATKLKLGILVNFGHFPRIEYERFAL